jgi:hypothetical protein
VALDWSTGKRCYPAALGDNLGSPLATYGVSVCGRILTRTASTVVCVVKQTHYLFSKKLENHAAAVALYFMHCNFGRVHSPLHLIPALEARMTIRVWSLAEILGVIGSWL